MFHKTLISEYPDYIIEEVRKGLGLIDDSEILVASYDDDDLIDVTAYAPNHFARIGDRIIETVKVAIFRVDDTLVRGAIYTIQDTGGTFFSYFIKA